MPCQSSNRMRRGAHIGSPAQHVEPRLGEAAQKQTAAGEEGSPRRGAVTLGNRLHQGEESAYTERRERPCTWSHCPIGSGPWRRGWVLVNAREEASTQAYVPDEGGRRPRRQAAWRGKTRAKCGWGVSLCGGGLDCGVRTQVGWGRQLCEEKGEAWSLVSDPNRKLELRWSDENIPWGKPAWVSWHPQDPEDMPQGHAQVGKPAWDIRTQMRWGDMHTERGEWTKNMYRKVNESQVSGFHY